MDWSKVAFIFPGQGSQEVGMGKSVADAYPVAMDTFKEADDILETNFSGLIFDGPLEELNDTYNTQASLFVTSVATLRALQQEMPGAVPAFAAG
ncbi:MAG: acyltransferase domain-containing protein, partial [Chloroflexota bacterium]